MVLESIITPKTARRNPIAMIILGILYAVIAIVLGYFIFPSDPSLSIIFLTSLAALPLMINVLVQEEEEDIEYLKSKKMPLIKDHMDVFYDFAFLFTGFFICFLIAYIFLPDSYAKLFFEKQIETIESILGPNGFFSSTMKVVSAEEGFKIILVNNFKVLLFAILFSFLYGAGAIFILAWNSSILSVAMGNFIKTKLITISQVTGITLLTNYFQVSSLGLLRYLIHGIPELSAYFFGAVAGGIISAAVIRRDYKDPRFYDILLDSLDLIALASLLLIIGALLEVSVTPWIIGWA